MKAFEMAERLGMTVSELLERMDAEELIEWTQFDRIFMPPGRVDAALICLTIARSVGDAKAKLDDYLPARLRADRDDDGEDPDLVAKLKAWATARIQAQAAAAPSLGIP